MLTTLQAQLDASCSVIQSLAELTDTIDHIAARVRDSLLEGHLLLTCGNGGSATDAQHLAEELTGRYRSNRRALPAIALTADTAALTCIANDFGYEQVFARQVEALARPGDLLLCFSTSGNSPNILAALAAARVRGAYSIAILGKDGGAARELADIPLVVASADTARIQEAHLQILHYICEVVEEALI
ncbi:MAG TPA: SIS domain-containing protein [Roseiflexaceae bacterium]|nr:SIS domain-containing protein [Roseiflexaceae bacterium]